MIGWYILCGVLVICDQMTKLWVLHALVPYRPLFVFPGLNWTLVFNSGSAFGFLNQSGVWWHAYVLTGFGCLMSIGLVLWIACAKIKSKIELLALILILSGALGNVIDRFRFGYVVDFIQVYYQNHYFPVFNIADSLICIGAALMLFADRFRSPR